MNADEYSFIIETDWSKGHNGYMLYARKGNEIRLVDIGSRVVRHHMSSYLGELDAMKWACSRTKAFRGSVPLRIKTNNQGLITRAQSGSIYDLHVRAYSNWARLLGN